MKNVLSSIVVTASLLASSSVMASAWDYVVDAEYITLSDRIKSLSPVAKAWLINSIDGQPSLYFRPHEGAMSDMMCKQVDYDDNSFKHTGGAIRVNGQNIKVSVGCLNGNIGYIGATTEAGNNHLIRTFKKSKKVFITSLEGYKHEHVASYDATGFIKAYNNLEDGAI